MFYIVQKFQTFSALNNDLNENSIIGNITIQKYNRTESLTAYCHTSGNIECICFTRCCGLFRTTCDSVECSSLNLDVVWNKYWSNEIDFYMSTSDEDQCKYVTLKF